MVAGVANKQFHYFAARMMAIRGQPNHDEGCELTTTQIEIVKEKYPQRECDGHPLFSLAMARYAIDVIVLLQH